MIRIGSATLFGLVASLVLASCRPAAEPPAPEVRPVRVVSVEKQPGGETLSLTGTVQAETEADLAFRIDGRMIERRVNVGDTFKAGQVVAVLDRENEESALRAARASLAAARGQQVEARDNFERFRGLVGQGAVSRAEFDG